MFIENIFVKNWLLQFRINQVRNSNSEILTCRRLQKSAGLVFSPQSKLQHGHEGSLFIWFVTAVDVTPMSKQVGHKKKGVTAQPRVATRRKKLRQTWNQVTDVT